MRDRHATYRLTLDDEARAVDAMRRVVDDWQRGPYRPSPSDRGVLARVGAHAIGCTTHDLRTVELGWLMAKADELRARQIREATR